MALSGSVATNHFSDSSVNETYMKFNWSATQSISGNYSTVTWEIIAHRVDTSNYVYFHNFTRNVNGSSGSKGSTNYKNDEVIDSGSFKVSHSDNGEGSFSISMSANVYYSSGGKISAEKTFVLDTIPRYAKVSASINKTTINSFTINWSTDSNVDRVQYKLNSGAWVDVETNVNKSSGSFVINGLTPNTSYIIGIDTRRKDSGLWSSHGNKGASLSKSTKQISIVSGSDFDLGNNENITYTNPNDGSTIQVGMFLTDGTTILAPYRIVTGTSYTFEFTDEELDKIYKAFRSSENLHVRIYSKTTLNNTEYSNYANIICNLTGNQKTAHINVDGVWKRAKRWTNVDGIWKRCVRWINVDGNWKRCI